MFVIKIEIVKKIVDQGELLVRVDFILNNDDVVRESFKSIEPNAAWLDNQIKEKVKRLEKVYSTFDQIELAEYAVPDITPDSEPVES